MADEHKLKRAVLKEEFVALTGDWLGALALNQMLYWLERRLDFDKFILEEQQRDPSVNMPLTHGWIWKTAEQLCEELMLPASMRKTISLRLRNLVESGWLDKRNNPAYVWDHTLQYRPNIRKIQHDLMAMGYVLDGYQICDFQSSGHCDQSSGHGDQTIPEITTETTDAEEEYPSVRTEGYAPFGHAPAELPAPAWLTQTPEPTRHAPPNRSSVPVSQESVPVREKKLKNGASAAPKTEHKDMIAAICEATGQTMDVRSVAGQIARASKDLRNAGVTPEQVRQFEKHWMNDDFRGQRGDKPTINQLVHGVDKFIKEGGTDGAASRRHNTGIGLGAKFGTAWGGNGGGGRGGYSDGIPAGVDPDEYLRSILVPRPASPAVSGVSW